MAEQQLNPKTVYEDLVTTRPEYEKRAEEMAKLTVASLFLPEGSSSSTPMNDSYSSRYASFAIDSLASHMELTLLPASGSSFRFDPDADAMEELTLGDANARAEIMKLLSSSSARVNAEIENQMIRPQLRGFLEVILSVSPVVVEKKKGKGIKWHGLRNFVVKLNDVGDPLQIVVREELDKNNLPEGIDVDEDTEDTVELYTLSHWDSEKWIVTQSIGSEIVGEESIFKEGKLPYVYLGWTLQKGDTYHRPYAERYKGILEDYGAINKVLVEGSIIASKSLIMVNPLGSTLKENVSNSKNGAVIDGRAEDITPFQLQKNYDFQIPMQMKQELVTQIDRAFLNVQGTQRHAERVTAEEIRRDAQELEKNLAGMYSILSKKFNKWLIIAIMDELDIKFDAINVNVITGLDALGKNIESQKLDNFVARMGQLDLIEWLEEPELITRYAAYDGIDTVNLVKTPNQVTQERQAKQQAAQQQAMMESGAQVAGQNLANTMTAPLEPAE